MEVTKVLIRKIEDVLERFQLNVINFNEATDKMIDIVEKSYDIEQYSDKPGIDFIKLLVAQELNVDIYHMTSVIRRREYVEARQIAMFLCDKLCDRRANVGVSLKQIGAAFGNRDHSTVIYACQTVSDIMDTDKFFKDKVLIIKQKIINHFKKNNIS